MFFTSPVFSFSSFRFSSFFIDFSFEEQLQFFGDDPQNSTVEKGKSLTLQCRVRTTDQSIKIQWLKKLENQRTFRPEAIVLDSDQYEIVERTNHQHVQYFNGILSKPLGLYRTTTKDAGQYVCLIQNDKISNYRKVFLKILDNENGKRRKEKFDRFR